MEIKRGKVFVASKQPNIMNAKVSPAPLALYKRKSRRKRPDFSKGTEYSTSIGLESLKKSENYLEIHIIKVICFNLGRESVVQVLNFSIFFLSLCIRRF